MAFAGNKDVLLMGSARGQEMTLSITGIPRKKGGVQPPWIILSMRTAAEVGNLKQK